jgi:hypothetical protein
VTAIRADERDSAVACAIRVGGEAAVSGVVVEDARLLLKELLDARIDGVLVSARALRLDRHRVLPGAL